jgi:hypothetical protein
MPPNRTSSSCSNTRTLPTASTTYGPMTMLLVPGCRSRLAYTLWCCATCTQFMLASTVYRPVPAPDAAATGGRRQGVGGGSGAVGMVGRRGCANGTAAVSSRRARDAGILRARKAAASTHKTPRVGRATWRASGAQWLQSSQIHVKRALHFSHPSHTRIAQALTLTSERHRQVGDNPQPIGPRHHGACTTAARGKGVVSTRQARCGRCPGPHRCRTQSGEMSCWAVRTPPCRR